MSIWHVTIEVHQDDKLLDSWTQTSTPKLSMRILRKASTVCSYKIEKGEATMNKPFLVSMYSEQTNKLLDSRELTMTGLRHGNFELEP